MKNKEECFANIDKDTCYCLNEKICNKKECAFYKTREQARREYLNTYSVKTLASIDKNINKYFRSL